MASKLDTTATVPSDGPTRHRAFGPTEVVAGAGAVRIRPARPTDEPLLLDLIERCSPDTVYRRFHGVFGTVARKELRRVANPTYAHRSWVAVEGGEVRGTVSLVRDRRGDLEIAILVEDAWGHRGLGRRLVEAALRDAARQGATEVVAWIQAENQRAIGFFRTVVPGATGAFVDGEVLMRLPVPAAVAPLSTAWVRDDAAPVSRSGRSPRTAGAPPATASRVRTA